MTIKHLVGNAGGGRMTYVALPISLLAAEAFYRAVERPSHLLARWIGAEVQRRTRQADRAVVR